LSVKRTVFFKYSTRGVENLQFSTEIAVYLGNGTRQARGQ